MFYYHPYCPPSNFLLKKKRIMTHPSYTTLSFLLIYTHVLKRSDTYVGSVESVNEKQWVYSSTEDKLEYKEITYVPAFLKIFNEILINADDNKVYQYYLLIILFSSHLVV